MYVNMPYCPFIPLGMGHPATKALVFFSAAFFEEKLFAQVVVLQAQDRGGEEKGWMKCSKSFYQHPPRGGV